MAFYVFIVIGHVSTDLMPCSKKFLPCFEDLYYLAISVAEYWGYIKRS